MTRKLTIQIKRAILTVSATAMALPGSFLVGTAMVAVGVSATAPQAEAARRVTRTTTVRRAPVRAPVRRAPVAAPTVRGTARRTTRRTVRRVSRRHFYTLPAGYRAVTYGAHRYYYTGGLYYYPYYVEGRTTYIQINVDASGNPVPPPPVEQMTDVQYVD